MNPAWVQTLRNVTQAVFRNLGLGEVRTGPGSPLAAPIRLGDAIGVAIDLAGARSGCLTFLFPRADAARIAAGTFPQDCAPDAPDSVAECLGELANVIGGHLLNGLASAGLDVALAPPRLLPGPDPAVDVPAGAEAVLIPVASSQGAFLLAFSLFLPSPLMGAAPCAGPRTPKETPLSKLRALVVDDSRVARSVVVRAFQNFGCEVVGLAADGAQAIEMFQRLKPDLVTLDLVMPDIDGVQALKEIKKIDPKAVVIVVSSVSKKETVVECIRHGATNYLLKPFDPARVGEVLAQCFPGRVAKAEPAD